MRTNIGKTTCKEKWEDEHPSFRKVNGNSDEAFCALYKKAFFVVKKCGVTQVKSHTHDQESLMYQWVFLASSGTLATKHGKFIFSKEERVIKAELINVLHYADSRNTYVSSYDNTGCFSDQQLLLGTPILIPNN